MNQETFNNLSLQERRLALLLGEFPESDALRIQKAYDHAKRAHEGQERDGGTPYIIHPLRVALILMDEAGERDADIIIAAFLHDVVEDCDDTIEDIRDMYNERIAQLVQDATRPRPEHETEEMKREAKPRKFRWYINEASVDSCKIKSGDVVDNMRSWQFIPEGHKTRDKFPRWCNEAETFYPDMTKKAGNQYYAIFAELARTYQAMPQFRDHLIGKYE